MWTPFLVSYAVLTTILIIYAAHVALSGRDRHHRADAYRVLKLVWTTTTSTVGAVGLTLKLHELGLM